MLITGATGVGKSSTINALFDADVSKVGETPNPETMEISRYDLGNLVIWDSPGLGDGKAADNRHAQNIIRKLNELDANGNLVIDLVLVLLDGSSRDLGTSFQLINEVIVPNLGANSQRLLVAINQADQAMKGRHWNYELNKPEQVLIDFLDEKVNSTQRRINDSTGIDVKIIYFSAGYKCAGEEQKPYNLSKLLYYVVQHTPDQKRVAYVDQISRKPDMWKYDDERKKYNEESKKSMLASVLDYAGRGAATGAAIGSIFGPIGVKVGAMLGGAIGAVGGLLSSLFG